MSEERRPVPARDVDLPRIGSPCVDRDASLRAPGQPLQQRNLSGDVSRGLREQMRAGRVLDSLTLEWAGNESHGLSATLLDQVARVEPGKARLLEHPHDQREELVQA